MMTEADSGDSMAIAARIRGLIAGQDNNDLGLTALRLGVSEVGLRMSVDDLSPHPTLKVITAIIREYGVDPSWLITGEYDVDVHRRSIEANAAGQKSAIDALSGRRLTRTSTPKDAGPSVRLEA